MPDAAFSRRWPEKSSARVGFFIAHLSICAKEGRFDPYRLAIGMLILIVHLKTGPIARASDERLFSIRLPAQSAESSLLEFARITDSNLLFPYSEFATVRVNALDGKYTIEEALDALLANTGLSWSLSARGNITIQYNTTHSGETKLKKPMSLMSAIAAALFSPVSAGQTAGSSATDYRSDAATLEEVVVTVRKQEESLQDVPMSITAFTSDDIERAGLRNIEDLSMLTPGFTFASLSGGDFSTPVIRGLSTTIGEANVGIFIDGVYQSSRLSMTALLGNFIERVEVSKGPQSALYGRNTFGGAINFVTKRPTDTLEGRIEATAGSDGKLEFQGAVSGPLVADKLYYQANAVWSALDGYFINELTGKHLDDRDTQAYSLSLLATPTENLDATFRMAFEDTDDGDEPMQFVENNAMFFARLNDFQMFSGVMPEITSGFAVTPGHRKRDNLNLSLNINWDLGPVTLTSITGHNNLDFSRAADRDFEARSIRYRRNDVDQQEWSQELRMASNGNERLDWMFGIYAYFLDAKTVFDEQFVGLAAGRGGLIANTTETTDSYSVFGRMGYAITDDIRASLSGRWSTEEKAVSVLDTNTVTGGTGTFVDDADFNNFTPRLSLDWKFTENHMLYGSVARAVKTGGFNTNTNTGAVLPDERSYDPEKSIHYEIGLKSSWLDNRLTTSVVGFSIHWQDQIVRGLGATNALLNVNAGKTRSDGFEIELRARLFENLDINAGMAYTDSRYIRYTFGALAGIGLNPILDGNQLSFVSKWTANTSAQYVRPSLIGAYDWVTRIDVAYQSKQSMVVTADAFVGDQVRVNLRTGLENGPWSVSFWIKNLLDEADPITGGFTTNNAVTFDFITGQRPGRQVFQGNPTASQPRSWGVTAQYLF